MGVHCTPLFNEGNALRSPSLSVSHLKNVLTVILRTEHCWMFQEHTSYVLLAKDLREILHFAFCFVQNDMCSEGSRKDSSLRFMLRSE